MAFGVGKFSNGAPFGTHFEKLAVAITFKLDLFVSIGLSAWPSVLIFGIFYLLDEKISLKNRRKTPYFDCFVDKSARPCHDH